MPTARTRKTSTYAKIRGEVLKLPLKQRADLAKRLLDSLDDLTEAEHLAMWTEESVRRDADLVHGRVKGLSVRQTMAKLREASR